MKLSEKIIKLRKEKGWSQEEFADKVGVSRQAVSKWELGAAIPDIEKVINMGALFGVSTDYLLKDESTGQIVNDSEDEPTEMLKRAVTDEEAMNFIDDTKKMVPRFANAVQILILSPILIFLLGPLTETEPNSKIRSIISINLSENLVGAISISFVLVLVAFGVRSLIYYGIEMKKYEYLGEEVISLESSTIEKVRALKEEYRSTYFKDLSFGIVLCIISAIPLLAAAFFNSNLVGGLSLAILDVIVSFGVNKIVYTCSINSSFNKLLQEEDFTPTSKKADRFLGMFYCIYWPCVTGIYLFISFSKNSWDKSWWIWVAASCIAILAKKIVSNNIDRKKRK